jgi:transposase
VQYSEKFKERMVRRLAMPGGPSASALAKEAGVSQQTLSRWLREAATLGSMADERREGAETKAIQRRPEDRSAEEKMRLVVEAEALSDEELGVFLRKHGIHAADLQRWREAMVSSLSAGTKRVARGQAKRVKQLERELRRKDKALAETAALLVLQKKVQVLLGDGDDDTEPESER